MTGDELILAIKEERIAEINGKDICFNFIEDAVMSEYNTCSGEDRFALYHNGYVVEVIDAVDYLRIMSRDDASAIGFAKHLCEILNDCIEEGQARAMPYFNRVYFIYDSVE